MTFASYQDVFREIGIGPSHPSFYHRITTFLNRGRSTDSSLKSMVFSVCSEEYDELSKRLDRTRIQDSASVRNVIKARTIATMVIGDDGEIHQEVLDLFVEAMQRNLYSLAPERNYDVVRDRHILDVLQKLQSDKELFRTLKHITRPLSNRLAEQVIKDTLILPHTVSLTDVHVRRACLAAWLTYLRQSLGSCFATAPAILIQKEQPHLFLRDLDEMMNTGRMKRTYGGKEYAVPMSITWGNGNLFLPFVLHTDMATNSSKMWMSPGVMVAMEAIGVLQEGLSLKEKMQTLRKRLTESIPLIEKGEGTILTCAEEIIRALILNRYSLKKKDVEEFLNRPKGMIQSGIMIYVPRSSKHSGVDGDSIASYLKDLEVAKTAFKAISENALLKSWEFTLASFSEISLDFCRWNLYASLGINYDDPGGIGECLYKIISQKIEEANNYLKERQIDYDEVAAQMHYLEGRVRQAGTERELNWIKMEYQSRQAELYHISQLRDIAHEKATKVARLNQFLVEHYDKTFRDYFQEVYDADLQEINQANPFDDSPAGFRLLYKHGRTNPSQWTRIYSLSEFIESLVSFFTITEQELASTPEIKGIESEFSQIITQLVAHVRSDHFMESAFFRMAKAHGVPCIARPLEHLEKVEKKPWVYTSGGSMSTLVSAYFRLEEKPSEVSRWVENEAELLAFVIDTLRQMPPNDTRAFEKNSDRSLLIHSPTHAFLLKPGMELFHSAWNVDNYTYTWIKQQIIEPTVRQLNVTWITEEMARDMIKLLELHIPYDLRAQFRQIFSRPPSYLAPKEFRKFIVQTVYSESSMRGPYGPIISADMVDSMLFSHLPYTGAEMVLPICQEVVADVLAKEKKGRVDVSLQEAIQQMVQGTSSISARRLIELIKSICALALSKTRLGIDVHHLIVQKLREKQIVLPSPIIIADTNWVREYFAFVVNPGTYELEFWTTDFYGITGSPMSSWKMWINGSRKDPKWGIFHKPHQYVG